MSEDTSGRLPTGVDGLDAALAGGVPAGSLVAVSATPRTQSEPLLYAMAGANPTRYLSMLRPEPEVREAVAASGAQMGEVDVQDVTGEAVLSDPKTYLTGFEPNTVVVADPSTELEQGERERYREFLDTCKRALRMTDSVGLLHCHENTPSVLRRDMTIARADQVWDVHTDVSGDTMATRLAVTKCRGGTPAGPFELAFDGGVSFADGG